MTTNDKHPIDILPFYANNTLSHVQKVCIFVHLLFCRRCREEAGFLKKLQTEIKYGNEKNE